MINAVKENDYDFDELVEECRHLRTHVPFENLLSGIGWDFHAPPGTTITQTTASGDSVTYKDGQSGRYQGETYTALFNQAVEELHRCLESANKTDFMSCVSNGVASFNAYITRQATIYNRHNPSRPLLDTQDQPVRLEQKIKEWIPTMTNGRKVNRGGRRWQDFSKLKDIRDNQHQHPKMATISSDYGELCNLLNLFKTGIAGMLLELHKTFGATATPPKIIRYAYLPAIEVDYSK